MVNKDYCNILIECKIKTNKQFIEIHNWLSNNIKPGNCYLGRFDYEAGVKEVYFSNKNDALYFSLVWV